MTGFSFRRSICTERTFFPSCSWRNETLGARSSAHTSLENSSSDSNWMYLGSLSFCSTDDCHMPTKLNLDNPCGGADPLNAGHKATPAPLAENRHVLAPRVLQACNFVLSVWLPRGVCARWLPRGTPGKGHAHTPGRDFVRGHAESIKFDPACARAGLFRGFWPSENRMKFCQSVFQTWIR